MKCFSLLFRLFAGLCLLMPGIASAQLSTTTITGPNVRNFDGRQYMLIDSAWHRFDPEMNQFNRLIPGSVTIGFAAGTDTTQINEFASRYNLTLVRTNILGFHDYRLSPGADLFTVADAIKDDGLVRSIHLNAHIKMHPWRPTEQNGNHGVQWHIGDNFLRITSAWSYNSGSPNVTVAVLDWGLDWDHPELTGNIYTNPGEDAWADPNDPTTGNGIDDDGNGLVDDWKGWDFFNEGNIGRQLNDIRRNTSSAHGTEVAGVMAIRTHALDSLYDGIAGGYGPQTGCKVLGVSIGGLAQNPFSGAYEEGIAEDILDDALPLLCIDKN